jgi:UDP-glucose 4-epimerase
MSFSKMKKNNLNQKILLAGGAGFIGLNLTEYLLEKTDWKINILDNLSSGNFDNLKTIKNFSKGRIDFLKGDIRNKNDVKRAIKCCDLVVNLAAQTGVMFSQKNPLKSAEVNIIGLLNLLEVSRKNRVRRFVQISSGASLGIQKVPFNEKKSPCPISPYGASKLAGEGYCSAFSVTFGLESVVLRLPSVYGPLSAHKKSVVHQFIKQIAQGKPVIIYGDGKQTRDFLYVKDASQAILLALTKKLPNNFELFQIGAGKETSINTLFKLVKKEFEKRGYQVKTPIYKPARLGEIKRNYTEISKAKRILNFQPKVKLEKGVSLTVENYLTLFKK